MSRKRSRRQPALRVGRLEPGGTSDTSPLANVYSDDAHELLTRAATEIRELADRMGMDALRPLAAKAANPWAADIPALLRRKGVPAEIYGEIVGDKGGTALASSLVATHLFSAQDHLYAIAQCLPQRTVLSLMSLSRVVLEAACTASWLNAGGLEPEVALWRAISLAYGHLQYEAKKAKEMSAWPPLSAGEIEELTEVRARDEQILAGFDDIRERLDFRALRVPVIAERMKLTMEALREANLGMPLPPDQVMLGFLHGAIHSDPNTLIGMMDTDIGGGMRTVSVRSRVQPVLWHAVAPAVMMLKIVDRHWDTNLQVVGAEAHATNLSNIVREAQAVVD